MNKVLYSFEKYALVYPAQIERLCRYSGGTIREILRLLAQALNDGRS